MPKGNYERSNIFDDIEVDDKNYLPTYKRILNQSKRQEATVIGFEDMYIWIKYNYIVNYTNEKKKFD